MGDFSVGGAELLHVTIISSRAQLLVPSSILRLHKNMDAQGIMLDSRLCMQILALSNRRPFNRWAVNAGHLSIFNTWKSEQYGPQIPPLTPQYSILCLIPPEMLHPASGRNGFQALTYPPLIRISEIRPSTPSSGSVETSTYLTVHASLIASGELIVRLAGEVLGSVSFPRKP